MSRLTLPEGIEPYYHDEEAGIVLYCADNRDVLARMQPGSVDVVITSPPYNVGVSPGGNGGGFYPHSRGGRSSAKWAKFHGYGDFDDALPMDEYRDWQRATLESLWALLADDGAIFYNHKPRIVFKQLWTPLELNPGLPLRQIITWSDGAGFALGDGHYCPSYEWLMLFTKPSFRLVDRGASAIGDLWQIAGETNKYGHPCPYPVELPSRVIRTVRPRSVLVPYAGVGASLVAAKILGCPAIGIELSERWCAVTVERLRQAVLPLVVDEPVQLGLEAS